MTLDRVVRSRGNFISKVDTAIIIPLYIAMAIELAMIGSQTHVASHIAGIHYCMHSIACGHNIQCSVIIIMPN